LKTAAVLHFGFLEEHDDDEDGGHTIKSATVENRKLDENIATLAYVQQNSSY